MKSDSAQLLRKSTFQDDDIVRAPIERRRDTGDKSMYILQNWLMHGISHTTEPPLIEKLDGIDIIYQEDYNDYD